MTTTFSVHINSGAANSTNFTTGDNISLLEINKSDDQYYQTGIITIFDHPSSQTVGDSIKIKIDSSLEFDGYLARKQQQIRGGKLVNTFQLIGKTYDLWRYHTGTETSYTGRTAFIASSLVSDFATGISSNFDVSNGIDVDEDMSFANMSVGEALVKLINLDGYKFYVDEDDMLQYYRPEKRTYDFTITEPQILDMSPIEEADEDLINDVLVIGGSDYSTKTQSTSTTPSSVSFPSGILVAQRFNAESHTLSAIQMYLSGTSDIDNLDALDFEIWESSVGASYVATECFDDNFTSEVYLNAATKNDISISDDRFGTDKLQIKPDPESNYATLFYPTTLLNDPGDYVQTGQVITTGNDCQTRYDTTTYWEFDLGDKYYLDGFYFYVHCAAGKNFVFGGFEVSGEAYTDGWASAIQDTLEHTTPAGAEYSHTLDFDSNTTGGRGSPPLVWSGVRKVRVKVRHVGTNSFSRFIDLKVRKVLRPEPAGSVESTQVSLGGAVNYTHLKVEPEGVGGAGANYIKYSGSLDGGTNWTTLTPDESTAIGVAGKEAVLKYKLTRQAGSWGDKYSNPQWTPVINNCKLTASYDQGDKPESGSKLVWSDDFSFTRTEIPYPPQWTSWKSWTSPKLSGLTINNNYWLVFSAPSDNGNYWNFYNKPDTYSYGKIMYSWDGSDNYKTNWSSNSQEPGLVPSGNLLFKLGWIEGQITGAAINQESIDTYGRHFSVVNDNTITTQALAQIRAEEIVSGSNTIPKKGSLTIQGRTDIETHYRFSSNLTNFGINDIWDVVSYTQRIDNTGFTTTIDYGRHPFDLTKKVTELEEAVY